MPIEAVEPRRLYRQIADQLRQLIDRGEYPVGSRLPTERALADMLGVSRPSVREALIALEVEGRLRIRVGSGIYVTNSPAAIVPMAEPKVIEGPFEILRARAFIESAVAEEAARLVKPGDVEELDSILSLAPPTFGEADQFLVLDRRFHVAVATILGNAVLARNVGELFDLRINPYFERLARHTLDDRAQADAHTEHLAIRNAIANHDPAAARAAMHEHLQRSHERFARDLGEKPEPASKEEITRTQAVA